MKQNYRTFFWLLVLLYIWQCLEMIMYGEIQARKVDNIMMMLFTPFIWKACE